MMAQSDISIFYPFAQFHIDKNETMIYELWNGKRDITITPYSDLTRRFLYETPVRNVACINHILYNIYGFLINVTKKLVSFI